MRNVLVIAAHPDDEVIGCGGTIARLVKERCTVFTLILGEGITSRDESRARNKRLREIRSLKKRAYDANKILGVKDVFLYDFPDNRFDSVPMLDIVRTIETIKNQTNPKIIFTHFTNDLNVDHQVTCKAVMTATRPVKEETVKEIYSFEILSSTEWNYPTTFSPDVFYDISSTIETKLEALKKYKSELRDFPHPRSLQGVKLNANCRGMKVGSVYVEAFKAIRIIR